MHITEDVYLSRKLQMNSEKMKRQGMRRAEERQIFLVCEKRQSFLLISPGAGSL